MVVFLVSDTVLEVVKILIKDCDLTQSEIVKRSKFTERAVRKALKRLIIAGIVSELNNVADLRFKRYRLKEVSEHE